MQQEGVGAVHWGSLSSEQPGNGGLRRLKGDDLSQAWPGTLPSILPSYVTVPNLQHRADRTSCDHPGTCIAMYSKGGHPERKSLHIVANLNKMSCRVKHGGGRERQPVSPTGDGFQTTLDAGNTITAIILKGLPHEDNPSICPVRVHGRQRRAHR